MDDKKEMLIKEALINESVHFINVTGHQFACGRDWKWCRGMVRHHLRMLHERLEATGWYAHAKANLTMHGENVISRFIHEQIEAKVDVNYLLPTLMKLDISYPDNI